MDIDNYDTFENDLELTNNIYLRSNPPKNNKRKREEHDDDYIDDDNGEDEDDDFIDTDDTLINDLMKINNHTIEEVEDDTLCKNPLCDHKDFTSKELQQQRKKKKAKIEPEKISNLDDLIKLGKTYHCKKNKTYFGINLRTLCNLVSPLSDLNSLVGMKNVKKSIVNQIVFFLQGFNKQEKCGSCLDCTYDLPCTKNKDDMLHTIITGSPGVGKSELGRILGRIYKAMGILSNGNFHSASRSDLIGKYLGHTADKTQKFIDNCKGGVMFIDEAYSLGHKEQRDSFSKECLDTLNKNMTERRDFLVIIAGYKDQLQDCFFSMNPGLERRFTFRYDIKEYSPKELMQILLLKVENEGWKTVFGDNLNELEKFFKKNKRFFPNFGGDVETLFLKCKMEHSKRMLFKDPQLKRVLTLDDVNNGFDVYINNRKYKEKTSDGNEMVWD